MHSATLIGACLSVIDDISSPFSPLLFIPSSVWSFGVVLYEVSLSISVIPLAAHSPLLEWIVYANLLPFIIEMWTRKSESELQADFKHGKPAPPLPARVTAEGGGEEKQQSDEASPPLSALYAQCTNLDPKQRPSAKQVLETLTSLTSEP